MNQPASAAPAAPKLSAIILAAIATLSFVVLAVVYAFLLFFVLLSLSAGLWFMGLVSLILSFVFYLIYAATHDRRVVRRATVAFFVIGSVSFYGSIALNAAEGLFLQLVWTVVLSVFVVIVLLGVYRLARGEERDSIRRSRRKLTP